MSLAMFECLFSIWQNCESTWVILYAIRQMFFVVKDQKNNLAIWSHWALTDIVVIKSKNGIIYLN